MRRKNNSFKIMLFSFAIIGGLIGFVVGYYTYSSRLIDQQLKVEEEKKQLQNQIAEFELHKEQYSLNNLVNTNKSEQKVEDKAVIYNEISIKENTNIKYRTLYKKSQEIIEVEKEAEQELIGLTESGLIKHFEKQELEYKIVGFTGEEVIILIERDQISPNCYEVKAKNGNIYIYQYDENGEIVYEENTYVSVKNLNPLDQEKIKRGIIRKTREEVEKLIEDYIS